LILLKPTAENIVGVASLIIWTLIILVTIEYSWLAMSLGKKGEGGTIVLRELLVPLLKTGRNATFVTLVTFVGISLLIGDGVITPAISILSAVEGVLLIPGMESVKQEWLLLVAGIIAIILFAFQKKGTEKVARAFGPLMLLWFFSLGVSGFVSLIQMPSMIKAISPHHGIMFLFHNGLAGFFILSEVILCDTGGEALYADMGHLGRKPIVRGWYFVFTALVVNYLGQSVFAVHHPEAKNFLFGMVYHQAAILYIPFLILSVTATVIASQAMISGMFSIVYQGINTRILPLFKVEYTSKDLRSQIYIAFVNWFLLLAVLFIMFEFRESARLAAAYGLAVSGTMTITGVLMTAIFYFRQHRGKMAIAAFVTVVDFVFLLSNMYKVPHGGYWSLIIATIPLVIIMIYTAGQRELYKAMRPLPRDVFLESYNQLYEALNKIKGTALFFARNPKRVPPYVVHTIFKNNILYENNIFVSIIITEDPFGVGGSFTDLAAGLRLFEIRMGYMEVVEIEDIIKKAGIEEKVIFYGLEEISSRHPLWKVFAAMKRLAPPFVQFHDLPPDKLHGVVQRVEM
jgi:KUP system potassium uptake protein